MRVEDDLVDVPGGSAFTRRWTPDGSSGRSPLFLLHDSLGSVELWRDFPHALADGLGRPVIAYDRLGFGMSSARHGLPSVHFVTEEAEIHFPALRSALGVTGYSLFGHSVGGAMALMIAASRDAGCEAVVTEATQVFVEQRTSQGISAAREQFLDPAQFEKLARWHGDKARWVLDAWTGVWLSPAFASWSVEPCLGEIGCPVLAIHGDRDEYGSLDFPRRIVSGVRGPSRLAILESCGHVPHREQRDRVLGLVSGFMSSVESSDPDAAAPEGSCEPKPFRDMA